MKVKRFEFSMFGVNTYLAIDEATKEAAVIDPSMDDASEQRIFDEYVSAEKLHLTQIINTHLHLDHCFGVDYVKTKYGTPVKANPDDAVLGNIMAQQYQMFGMRPKGKNVSIDVELRDGDIVEIGKSRLKVITTPGHTEGGISLYDEADKILFTGDTIFNGSIGRTDLPGGNHRQLISSIRNKVLVLPDDVKILPGHGPATTVGFEKAHNPYIR